jgi:hypothetical protein
MVDREVRVACRHCDGTGKCECPSCVDGFRKYAAGRADCRLSEGRHLIKDNLCIAYLGQCMVCKGAGWLHVPVSQAEEVMCQHCRGTGKCACYACIREFGEQQLLSDDQMAEMSDRRREVLCTVCRGTGTRFR